MIISLENLAKLMTEPLTKSGINHRLRKIVQIANNLKENNQKMEQSKDIGQNEETE